MSLEQVNIICFSPTQSTKKILQTIAAGITADKTETLDLTLPSSQTDSKIKICADLALIGVPVYGGRVPLAAVSRLQQLKAEGTPAAIIVVYGNRHYDDALLELNELSVNCGFKPIAAGAFVSEHSFSLAEYPIAQSRPDTEDLQKATLFGQELAKQLQAKTVLEQLAGKNIPGNYPYIERKPSPPFAPETDKEKCGNCRKCVVVCPTGAIDKRDNTMTDVESCILCGACVKVCEKEARAIKHPAFIETAQRLSSNFQTRREPEIFIG
jgi:ferredoxin/flavodoxin